jgi:nucleotide-binding universal stress UspA family protein
MRWLVGFDPTPSSVGVVRFAAWLHARSEGRHALHGVYVDTSPTTGLANEVGSGPDLTPAERDARAFLEEQGVGDAFARVEAVHGAPEKVLQALAKERDFDGVLIGRAAPSDKVPLVSLGRVPRRLLRALELSTIVVAPDAADRPTEELGPIVVGVAPTPESLEAAGFAVLLGEELELPVVLAHVVPPSRPVVKEGVLRREPHDPAMSSSDIVAPEDTSGPAAAIEEWATRHGLDGLPLELRVGHVPVELVELARERHATMIVCGSRRLSLIDRLFTSSVGSELATHADRPVVVVPSDGRGP